MNPPILAETSIIVYRNPLEKMFWENDSPTYFFIGTLSLLVGLWVSDYILQKTTLKRNKFVFFILSAILSILIYKLSFWAITYL